MLSALISEMIKLNLLIKDKSLLNNLIKHKLNIKKNKFIKYVNDTFNTFCNFKKQIIINLHMIYQFTALRDLLFEDNDALKIQFITKLFTNVIKLKFIPIMLWINYHWI